MTEDMTVKEFFKALSTGVRVMFDEAWPFLKILLFGGALVNTLCIMYCANNYVVYIISASCMAVSLSFLMVDVLGRCNEAVKYAKKHEVDMKIAWRKTAYKDEAHM